MQNVFFLPPAAADFLRLRCSSKRCGRVLKIWHKCHCRNCIQEQSKKKSERETHIFATITSPLPSTSDECKIHIRETKEEEFLQDVLN